MRVALFGSARTVAIGMCATAPAQASVPVHAAMSFRLVDLTPAAAAPGRPAPAVCAPSLDHYNRTQLCWLEVGTIIIEKDGKEVGTVVVSMVQSIGLHIIGRNFGESLVVTSVTKEGSVPDDIEMFLDAHCGHPCSTGVHFPQGTLLEEGVTGTISHHDSIGAGKVHSTHTSYELELTAPNVVFTPGLGAARCPIAATTSWFAREQAASSRASSRLLRP
jgi:hypothetical protein